MNTNHDQADAEAPPLNFTQPNYPTAETAGHPPTHRRVFCVSRLRPAREAAGLTIEQVAERLADDTRALDLADGPEPVVVTAWEIGALEVPAWAIYGLASIYRVSCEAFSECFDCRAAWLHGTVRS